MSHEHELEETIKEIAAKHGIAVGRDDPILILQTLNHRLMQVNQKAQQALLDQYKSELEGISLRWSTDAKDKAERILNSSLDASQTAMEQLLYMGTKEVVTMIKAEIGESINRISRPIKDANRIGLMNITASCITMLAAAILLWTTTHL
jgi:hypothetical protein